jgi:hypothetical protein
MMDLRDRGYRIKGRKETENHDMRKYGSVKEKWPYTQRSKTNSFSLQSSDQPGGSFFEKSTKSWASRSLMAY